MLLIRRGINRPGSQRASVKVLALRQRVIERVNQGYSVEETAERLQVSPATVYCGRDRPFLERTVPQRRRQLPPEALRQAVRDYPETRLKALLDEVAANYRCA